MQAKTFKRRDFIRAAALAATGVLAAACQPKVVEVEKVVKETVVVAGTPQVVEKVVKEVVKETVVVEKKVEVPAKGIKIQMYHAWHRAIAGPVIEPMVREFEQTHPGIFIALTGAVPAELGPMIMAAVAAGTPPSITWGSFGPLVRAQAVVPVDDYITKYGYEKDKLYPYLVEAYTIKGKLMAMPVENSSVSYWYHNPLLEKAGLDKPKSDWDWNDLAEYGRKLTIVEGGVPVQYGLVQHMNKHYYFLTLLYQLGGSFLTEDLTKPAFNSEAGVKALTWIADRVLKDKSVPPPGGGFENGFVSLKYAMAFDGPWRFGNYVNELKLDLETVIHPKCPDTGRQDTIVYGGTLQLMKTTPEEQDAAFQFLAWFLSKDNNARWAVETGYLPVRTDSAETPKYKDFLAGQGKVMASFLEGFKYGHLREGSVVLPKYGDMTTIFNDECWDRVMLGERTVEEGLAAAEKAILADKTLFERIDL